MHDSRAPLLSRLGTQLREKVTQRHPCPFSAQRDMPTVLCSRLDTAEHDQTTLAAGGRGAVFCLVVARWRFSGSGVGSLGTR